MLVFVEPSVAVSVTVTGDPTFVQSKVLTSTVNVGVPQLSEEPLSMSPATMLALPAAST